jgi:hypothetical protein
MEIFRGSPAERCRQVIDNRDLLAAKRRKHRKLEM